MPIVEYPYLEIPAPPSAPFPNGQLFRRPLLVATLTAETTGKILRCLVCPDSGADYCLFPTSFAALLGLDVLTMPKNLTIGVGSSANTTYYGTLGIDVGMGIAFKSYVGFTTGLDSVGLGLLGQAGFFEYYNVTFRYKDRRFIIEST
jgi:hypothetical protein